MTARRRSGRLWIALAAVLGVLAAAPSLALAHAVLISSTPAPNAKLTISPPRVVLHFNETVQLLKPTDMSVVDSTGRSATAGPAARDPANSHNLQVVLRPGLAKGTYTVRYLVVSADSHIVGGAQVFGVGPGLLGQPFLGGSVGQGGPSETSVWAVSARFLELVGLGGLLGLLAWRWLVWRPAWRAGLGFAPDEETASLAWGRDVFWVAFGVLAVGSMLAEGYLLVVKSASALGVSVWDVLKDPSSISTVLGSTEFGSLVQLRGALLFVLFALGIWQFLSEYGSEKAPRPARVAGQPLPALLMTALIVVVLGELSYQGHASQAPYHQLEILDDAIHLDSVAVWIGGLAFVGLTFWAIPRVAPVGGPGLSASVLARFSAVATVAVGVAIVTGVLRAVAELSEPSQLWDTAYGRSIIYKVLLLCPVAYLAFRNRRVIAALRTVKRPSMATIRMVRRSVALEFAFAIGIVVVAAVLVAQVPGRV